MKKLSQLFLLFLASLTTSSGQAALTLDPKLQWKTLYTEHFEIHYHNGIQQIAPRVAAIAEQVHEQLAPQLEWTPQQRTQVILNDRMDFANGSAMPVPRNEMRLFITPPRANSVIGHYDDWLTLLIVHEYTHILHLDKRRGIPDTLQKILGRHIFLFPNLLQPPWLIEGLATYYETDSDNQVGRGVNSMFRLLMRSEVENGIKPVQQVNQPLVSWPMNTARYLYGVYFFNFVRDRYGEEKIRQLVHEYSNNILPFAINTNNRITLGKKLDPLWQEFANYLHEEFQAELNDAERNRFSAQANQITHTGYFTSAPHIDADGTLYFIQNDMASESRLMALAAGEKTPKPIAKARTTNFDLHPEAGAVFVELDAYRNTNIFGDLYVVDVRNGQKSQLTKGKRYLYASWSPDGRQIIAVHNEAGQSALHLLDHRGELLEVLWQGENDVVIGPPHWSPDGKRLVASVWRPHSNWNLETFALTSRHWQALTHDRSVKTQPRFTPDGKAILFSADYDGIFDIRRLELGSGKITTLTQVKSGAFYPAPAPEGIYYLMTHGDGYDVFFSQQPLSLALESATTQQQLPASQETSKPAGAQTSNILSEEDYNALKRIAPTAWFPYLRLSDDLSEIGFITAGADPLRRHNYNLLFAYDTKNEWPIGYLSYLYDRWNPALKLSFFSQIFTELDGNDDLAAFRRNEQITLEAIWPWLRYERQWLFHLGLVSEHERDESRASWSSAKDDEHDALLGAAVSYNSSHRYARSISPSDGQQLRLVAEDSETLKSDYSGQVYSLDWRGFLGVARQHVLATRAALGWGTETPNPFKLGGSFEAFNPTSLVEAALAPTQQVFGRRHYPLRGYPTGLDGLSGRRMALLEAEWRFPIALVERGWMAPPLGLHQLHGKLFYNGGEAWNQGSDIPSLRNGAGVEITAELVLGYWLPLDLRLGLARGFAEDGEDQVYLELASSF